ACSTKQFPDLQHFLGSSPILARYEGGQLTRSQFFAEMQQATGFTGNIDEFSNDLADIFLPIEPMIGLHEELRRRGYLTYIFSNTNDIAIEHVRQNFPFFKTFDGYVFSYEARSMKPDAKIYEAMEKLSGRRGADLVYIDDRPENIATGAGRGWRAILHETPEKTRAALQKLIQF
ncbi:MAG TPA: HAD-IA family hydrolase, partial [Candidatus Baltobacteraceae bacterium]|nr:HAD-IA family hydrolase [Candidatus Baltobacteraceae bacterium]